MARQVLTEATAAMSATPVAGAPGRFLIELINPGWGSSGYYSSEVLEAAGKAKIFPAGLHQYMDHPTASEQYDRPERSVRDLAAVLNEDAHWNGAALVAEATVFGSYREVLEQMADSIGVSIRAYAEASPGEAEGRHGMVITELIEGVSADFVTHAGRGGKILQVIESARAVEATANDTRELLNQTLTDAYGGERQWVGVRDFDEATVWFWQSTPDSEGLWQLGYSLSDAGVVELAGDPVEVRVQTTYVPVVADSDTTAAESGASQNDLATRPGSTETTDNPKEPTMGTIQVDEADHRRLTEAAGRVTTLEAERDTAIERATIAETENVGLKEADAIRTRVDAATAIVAERAKEAGVEFTALEARGLLAGLPVKDDGVLDAAAFTATVDEAVTEKGKTAPAFRPYGLGDQSSASDGDVASILESIDKTAERTFGIVKEA